MENQFDLARYLGRVDAQLEDAASTQDVERLRHEIGTYLAELEKRGDEKWITEKRADELIRSAYWRAVKWFMAVLVPGALIVLLNFARLMEIWT